MRSTYGDLLAPLTTDSDQVVGRNDQVVGRSDQVVGFDAEVRALCMAVWPRNTAANLAVAADITVRQAERLLERKDPQGFSLKVYRRLMFGAHGKRFHQLLMKGCAAAWWGELDQERQLADLRRQKRAIERELQELEGRR